MRRGWIFAAAGLAALFGLFLSQSIRLPLLDELGPGPGFFPLAISAFGLLLSFVLLTSVWRNKQSFNEEPSGNSGFKTVLIVLSLVAVSALVLEYIGYTLTTLMLVPAILISLGARSKLAIGIVSLVMSFGIFHVFYYWLNVALPVGVVGI